MTVESEMTADGNKYTLNSEIQHQDTNSLFHVVTQCPSGKTEILSKFQKLGDKEYKGNYINSNAATLNSALPLSYKIQQNISTFPLQVNGRWIPPRDSLWLTLT